ncbi:MAG: efflux RND transporter periplasmic adaptor subunit [Cellvibrionaceae bacterium]|nr:efflux RND transporter periplasmic adaptor subunit [Cellvibrionaceae bacterium]
MSFLIRSGRFALQGLLFCCSMFALSTQANKVELIYPKSDNKGADIQISASVEALQHSQLAAQQAGLLAELYVEVGDTVQTGDLLLKLDDQLAKLELNQAEASLEAAQVAATEANRLYKELKALASKKFVATTLISERRAQLAQSRAELSKQKAALAIKQEELRRHTLRAPFNGVIANRQSNIGEWINQQSIVLSLVQQDALRLRLSIPQEYFATIKLGAPVVVSTEYGQAKSFNAEIDRIVPISSQLSRAFEAYVTIPNTVGLNVGMSATVKIPLLVQQDLRLWFPKSAIKQHPDGGASVFAVENKQAKRYIVKLIDKQGDQVSVSGAPANMAYINGGVELLRDGDPVEPTAQVSSKEPQQ